MFSIPSISALGAGAEVIGEFHLVQKEKRKYSNVRGVRIAPANEEFAVWMPELPKVGTEQVVINQQSLVLTYYGLIQNGTEYAVISVLGLENKMADLAHMLMLNLYGRLIPTSLLPDSEESEVAIKANYQRDISLNGYAGREYRIEAGNRTGFWRFYSVGKKFYAVAASTTRQDNVSINTFLNSFALGAPTSAIIHKESVQPQLHTGNQAKAPTRPSLTETWLVILKTFSKAERSKAQQEMRILRNRGYDAHILDTDYYPNLKKGFLVVAMGPHARATAVGVLNKMRSVVPGSYLKSGW